jgi:hypothetical protein
MPGLGDYLYDLLNPQAQPDLPNEAGLNDIRSGPGQNIFNPLDPNTSGAPMPLDPRMLAYQNQQNAQLAQQAWQRQPPPTQMAQPAPQLPQPEGPSWADAFYKLIAPGMGGGGTAGPRY